MKRHKNLGKKNNDECYTPYQVIYDELSRWAALGKFKNKKIICPCDRDDEDVTSNFIKVLTENATEWGIKSITASGYDPETGRGVKFQDVDYTKYDICCTNPPFSLYREFMKCIVGKIDFVCLAPFLNRATPNVSLPLMLKQAYLGFGVGLGISFSNPTKENNYSGVKGVRCDWITSWPEAQEERNKQCHKTGINYELYKDEYIIMENMTMKDGTHPIKVNGAYPDDYTGWMFGPVSLLDQISHDEYEVYGTNYKKYYNTEHPENNPFNHKASEQMLIHNGKQYFHGIVFRKKKGE